MSYLTDDDVVERFRGARPGRDLIAIEDAVVPVTVLRVLVSAQEEKPLPLLEEFVLRSLYNGLEEVSDIAAFLGLAPQQLDDALVAQVQAGNLTYRADLGAVALSARGRAAAIDLMSIAAVEQEIPACFDRSIWRVVEYREIDLIAKKDARDQGMIFLPASRSQHIEREDLKLMDLEHLVSAGKGRARRLQLLSILRARVTKHRYLPVKLALFSDGSSSAPEVLVAVNGEESFSHQRELEALGGATALRMVLGAPVQIEPEPAANGTEPDQHASAGNSATSTPIGVMEHPHFLRTALTVAKRRILIVSSQIRGAVVNPQFVSSLERRLREGVEVVIGYGTNRDNAAADEAAINRLNQLERRFPNLTLRHSLSSHAPLLVYDDVHVVSMFDWLAFKGNPSRVYRPFDGVAIEGAGPTNRVYQHYPQALRQDHYAAQHPPPSSWARPARDRALDEGRDGSGRVHLHDRRAGRVRHVAPSRRPVVGEQ